MHEKIGWREAHEASTLDIWSCENLTTSKIQLSILTRCRGNVRWMLVSAILWMLEKTTNYTTRKFFRNGQNLKQNLFQELKFRQFSLNYNPFLWYKYTKRFSKYPAALYQINLINFVLFMNSLFVWFRVEWKFATGRWMKWSRWHKKWPRSLSRWGELATSPPWMAIFGLSSSLQEKRPN